MNPHTYILDISTTACMTPISCKISIFKDGKVRKNKIIYTYSAKLKLTLSRSCFFILFCANLTNQRLPVYIHR